MSPYQAMNDDSPLVSVIMIFLNEERFISEAVNSVLAQTYANWELLLVDDGSHDASSTIAATFARQRPQKIRYLQHPHHVNLGMSASRNLGVENASGKYVAFLDADDVWLPHTLAQQIEFMQCHPRAGMVYGLTQYWYSWTGEEQDQERDRPDFQGKRLRLLDRLIEPPHLLLQFLEDGGTVPCMCSVIVRRHVLEAIGGFENRFKALYEDQAFYAKAALHTTTYAHSKLCGLYRQHPASSCAVAVQQDAVTSAYEQYLSWLAQYVSDQPQRYRSVQKALQRAQRRQRYPQLYQWLRQIDDYRKKARNKINRNAATLR